MTKAKVGNITFLFSFTNIGKKYVSVVLRFSSKNVFIDFIFLIFKALKSRLLFVTFLFIFLLVCFFRFLVQRFFICWIYFDGKLQGSFEEDVLIYFCWEWQTVNRKKERMNKWRKKENKKIKKNMAQKDGYKTIKDHRK